VTVRARTAVNRDVDSFLTDEFSNPLGDVLVLLEIDRFNSKLLLSELETERDAVNTNNSRSAFDLRPLGGVEADWAQSLGRTFELRGSRDIGARANVPKWQRCRPFQHRYRLRRGNLLARCR
jgi:hypothetical protein